ncbi:MAG: tripartite tricarboxylate transporter substrate-binding protein, partial [Pseudohongiella sp.]|nr:tripartite tricarboxylate transporter substrate-binding protein [Pseudohongiella sp.]
MRTAIQRRTLLISAIALQGTQAWSNSYPNKPIKIVVPSPPGGSTDQLGRLVGQHLQKAWGQSVIVDNKPGAGLRLGADFVAKSPADGYTLLVGAIHHSIAQAVYSKRSYDLQNDLTPITVIGV